MPPPAVIMTWLSSFFASFATVLHTAGRIDGLPRCLFKTLSVACLSGFVGIRSTIDGRVIVDRVNISRVVNMFGIGL